MPLDLVCGVHLVRHPVGGLSWHHLQYLVGLKRLGHRVTFFEDWGWPDSCYDVERNIMTSDPTYGIDYVLKLLRPHGLEKDWGYLAQDGTAHGLSRAELAARLRECDAFFNLSGVNYIPEIDAAKRRILSTPTRSSRRSAYTASRFPSPTTPPSSPTAKTSAVLAARCRPRGGAGSRRASRSCSICGRYYPAMRPRPSRR